MSNTIFNYDISNNVLYDFLDKYCVIENNYYIINNIIFKKYEYNDNLNEFINNLKNYYKKRKFFYLERTINYNNLLTIIRHICKFKNIEYFSKIKYDRNKYNIVYFIKKEI